MRIDGDHLVLAVASISDAIAFGNQKLNLHHKMGHGHANALVAYHRSQSGAS